MGEGHRAAIFPLVECIRVIFTMRIDRGGPWKISFIFSVSTFSG
jgi:hypothetical protein